MQCRILFILGLITVIIIKSKGKMAQPSKGDLHREISDILDGADLSALSSKKVRLKLQEIFDVDLSDRKKEIDQILMAVIAKCQSARSTSKRKAEEKEEEEEEESRDVAQTSRRATERGDARHSDSSSDELKDSSPPAKKKKKKKKAKGTTPTKTKEKTKSKEKSSKKKDSKSSKKREAPKSQANVVDSDDEPTINDEELAWKLHQEETRRTRNHSTRKSVPTKTKTASKKQNGTAKDKPKTGYVADMILSPELASIIGADKMSRHEVVKKMWAIIKERKLEDPKNKQFHICDDELLKVFGQRRIRTFSMMKYLKGHIKDPKNLTTPV